MSITLALIIAGGTAAGVALARPAATSSGPVVANAVPTADTGTGDAAPDGTDYGNSNRRVGRPVNGSPAQATGASPAPDPAAPSISIGIRDFAFERPPTASPGQDIVVSNADGVTHTFTLEPGQADTGPIGQGTSVTVTAPGSPGTYQFFCTIHPSMRGELVVQG